MLGMFLPFLTTNAAKIANVTVNADRDNLNLLWDPLSSSDFGDADGYAIQFSEKQGDVQITKSVTSYQSADDVSLRRNSFENNTYYFARIYTYKIDDENDRVLGNGSDMLRFRVDFNDQVETNTISVTDPVISSSSGEEQDNSDYEFGVLRKYPYDTFTDLFWSQPRLLTSSDFDGFLIKISKSSDLEDPILEATVDSDTSSVRITGLSPNTTYYAQGFFYKEQGGENKTFGDSPVRSFETIVAIPRDNGTREARNITKVENRAIRKIDINSTSSSTTSSSSSSTSSSSSSSSSSNSSSTSISTSSQAEINSASQAEIKTKIAEIKKQINTLQSELRKWEAKVEGSSTTTAKPSYNLGLSIRERLKLILEAKRNQ